MSTGQMSGFPRGRHRLGVLPGLSSRSETASNHRIEEIPTTMATMDDESSNKQLVPLSRSHSKMINLKNWTAVKSRDSDESVGAYFQNMSSRVSSLEDANKAILEEVYRLQSNVRASDFTKKGMVKDEKRVQRELMDTIRSSNDVVAQLTSRLRKAEEKLHQEKENVKNLMIHSKKLEQVLFNAQKEADAQRDAHNIQAGDLKQRMDEILRRWEKNDRISEGIIDEFHQMKNKVDIQSMEFVHLQTELKQRSKRTEDELKQTMQQARFQQDTNSIAEQNNIQLRHLLEARMSETRDAVNEMRNRITQNESNSRSQVQQLTVKLTDIQSNLNNFSHRRQEEMQSLEKNRQEQHHQEENERYKLQNKIQTTVDEMNEKLIQKEVRLREEALKKFVDVEKLFQKEESARLDFEKYLREDVDARWSVQHKLYVEEMEAIKEIRRNDKSQQIHNFKKIDDCLLMLDRKIKYERKTLEKVLLAEIMKREVQARQVSSQVDGVKEQLRVALQTLQEAISGLHMQTSKIKEQLMKEIKTRLTEEQDMITRAMRDVDARLTAISTRLTHQEESLETRMNNFKQSMQEDYNEQLRNTTEWRSAAEKEMAQVKIALQEIPQEIRETQERMTLLKEESETKLSLESESRLKEAESIKKQIRHLLGRLEDLDNESIYEKTRLGKVETELISLQGNVGQMEQLSKDVKSNLVSRVNSETKMRLEETAAIKRDLARLRVDFQPLLWEHNNKLRSFVKAPVSFLNEWGIYQCARWYDIKMRWLRLLDRSRKRKMGLLKPDFRPALNSMVDMETGGFNVDDDSKNPDSVYNPSDNSGETPLHDDVSIVGEEPKEGQETSRPESPQKAWYNQESVLKNEAGAEIDSDEAELPERKLPDGYDESESNERLSSNEDKQATPSPPKTSDHEQGDKEGKAEKNSKPGDTAEEDFNQQKVPSEKNEQHSEKSGRSRKSRLSDKPASTRTSPGDDEDSNKASFSRRKSKHSRGTPNKGNAYDMEGRI